MTDRPLLTIDHIVDSLDVGGAERIVLDLARHQTRAGARVHVHCLFAEGSLAAAVRDAGAEVLVHSASTIAGRAWGLGRRLSATRPDVVHCHNVAATVVGAPLARLAGVGRVLSTRHGLVGPVRRHVHDRKFWAAARACDRVVAVCERAKRHLERQGGAQPDKVVVVVNGASPAPGGGLATPGANAAFTIVSVARLSPVKDVGTLLRAVAIARRTVTDLRLVVVGGGPDRTALEAMARDLVLDDCVTFAGEQLDAGARLQTADLFVLSSLTEGLPVALIEALAAGLPAVVSDVGGMPDVIDASGAGRVVSAGAPEAFANAITSLAAERGHLARLGGLARSFYETHLTPERMHADYWQLMVPSNATGIAPSPVAAR